MIYHTATIRVSVLIELCLVAILCCYSLHGSPSAAATPYSIFAPLLMSSLDSCHCTVVPLHHGLAWSALLLSSIIRVVVQTVMSSLSQQPLPPLLHWFDIISRRLFTGWLLSLSSPVLLIVTFFQFCIGGTDYRPINWIRYNGVLTHENRNER